MSIIVTPRISEKAYAQAGSLDTYVFVVPLSANKLQIKNAVEQDYSVNVLAVNIVRQNGKPKQSYRKGGRAMPGVRSDSKKAYVRIKSGQSIPVFAAQEQEAK